MTTTATVADTEEDRGLKIEKMNESLIDAEIAARKIALGKAKTLEQKARVLHEHFHKSTPRAEQFPCGECAAKSPQKLDTCPFCGYAGDLGDPAASPGKAGVSSFAIVKASPTGLAEVQTVKDLDRAVAAVHALKKKSALTLFDLGRAVAALTDTNLWQLRTTEDGKTKWKSFDAFCHAELAMSPSSAMKLARVTSAFDREMVETWGRKKLELVLQAPPEERPKLLEAVTSGASKSEVEARVRASNVDRESVPKRLRTKAGAAGTAPEVRPHKLPKKAAAPAVTKVTVSNVEGTVTVPLYKAAAVNLRKLDDAKSFVRAKKVGDDPLGWEDMGNGTRRLYRLTQSPAGELRLKITTKRIEE